MSESLLLLLTGQIAVIVCPLTIWGLLTGLILAICLAVRDGIDRLQRLHQIPCSHCAFYTGDHRLKCTVHPCRALSEEAIACLDYEPCQVRPPVNSPCQKPTRKFTFLKPNFYQ
jgi:hypothetical protein